MDMELRQRLQSATRLNRHRHEHACVSVVLEGGYDEAGDGGRWHTQPGDVLIYLPFTSHQNFIPRASSVLNLPLPRSRLHLGARYRVRDADALVLMAERDVREAGDMLFEQLLPARPACDEPVDRLACQLVELEAPRVHRLARELGVRRETLYRRFRAIYGTSPTRYRVEARARRAWLQAATGTVPLAALAVELGFSDQAHMSRAVRGLTGMTPRQWRATFVQDRDPAAR